MSKLLKFKKWVSIPEAATLLSKLIDEPVTTTDLHSLAKDGHILLSVLAKGFPCYPIKTIETEPFSFSKTTINGRPDEMLYGAYPIADYEQECATSELYGDQLVTAMSASGLVVLLEDGSEVECFKLSELAYLEEIINTPTHAAPPNTTDSVLESLQYSISILETESEPIALKHHERPSIAINDLVIRTTDLMAFADSANDTQLDKPLDKRERASLERLIGILAKMAKLDLSKASAAEASVQLQAGLMGIDGLKGKGTITKYLRAAKARCELGEG